MKTVIISGANSGLGFETAKKIARQNAYQVILACRDMDKAEKAKERIVISTGSSAVKTMQLDTASFASVRRFAAQVDGLGIKIDALICNAGISPMHSGTTEDGFELVFETNYLGHFMLVNLLLPHMAEDARILNVSSDMHNPPGGIEWPGAENLAHPAEDDRRKYSYSKLCNLYFTYELDRRLREASSHIAVNAFNPGMMETNFAPRRSRAEAEARKQMFKDRVGDLAASSDALAELATSDAYGGITGKYFDRATLSVDSSPLSYSRENALELWDKSVEWTHTAGK